MSEEDTLVDDVVPSMVDPMTETSSWRTAGRYEPRAVLGRGGMGEVQLCHDDRIGREVAYKQILPNLAGDPELVARFLREARVQGQLEHPAIVPVHDMGMSEDGAAFFTMKRVRGVTLDHVLTRLGDGDAAVARRFTRRKLLAAMVTVSLAVDFAHERGVLHRDLKPENVMLGDHGEVYVLDWGLAKVGASADPNVPSIREVTAANVRAQALKTRAGDVLGTPGFMSPEQVGGQPLDARSDVYALGAILFELLTLEPLHPGRSYPEIASSTLSGVDARPSVRRPDRHIPPELDALCVRATALDPAERVQSARELSEMIEAFLEGDQNLTYRRELAARHADAAWRALEIAPQTPAAEEDLRRLALREATAAVALDPTHERARGGLIQALTEPFAFPPAGAVQAFELEEADRTRQLTTLGTRGWAATLGYLPLFLWMGVRSPALVAALFSLLAGNAAVYAWVSRQQRLGERHVLGVLAVNTVAVGAMAVVCGPFLIVPAVAAVNVMAFLLTVRYRRAEAVAVSCLAVVVPFALDRAGVLPAGMSFDGSALSVRAGPVWFPDLPTSIFLLVSSVGTIITAALIIVRVKARLTFVEQRLHVYAWQLGQLLPPLAGARTTRRVYGG